MIMGRTIQETELMVFCDNKAIELMLVCPKGVVMDCLRCWRLIAIWGCVFCRRNHCLRKEEDGTNVKEGIGVLKPEHGTQQIQVEALVFEGERSLTKDCRSLGNCHLSELPQRPRGTPQIEVTFEVDANGVPKR
ncbi:hypothetical protein IFM89_003410 [Coptis chinensis]|uniref:Uncharacterized protein n=1 Tax=Coptis chinensis TaxID=261450 RepID=A0A835LHF4_9MAGN|nr:hypothetical protein IFM89_003410 [Coptis chinensis]